MTGRQRTGSWDGQLCNFRIKPPWNHLQSWDDFCLRKFILDSIDDFTKKSFLTAYSAFIIPLSVQASTAHKPDYLDWRIEYINGARWPLCCECEIELQFLKTKTFAPHLLDLFWEMNKASKNRSFLQSALPAQSFEILELNFENNCTSVEWHLYCHKFWSVQLSLIQWVRFLPN